MRWVKAAEQQGLPADCSARSALLNPELLIRLGAEEEEDVVVLAGKAISPVDTMHEIDQPIQLRGAKSDLLSREKISVEDRPLDEQKKEPRRLVGEWGDVAAKGSQPFHRPEEDRRRIVLPNPIAEGSECFMESVLYVTVRQDH
jgi:hypothetical protein